MGFLGIDCWFSGHQDLGNLWYLILLIHPKEIGAPPLKIPIYLSIFVKISYRYASLFDHFLYSLSTVSPEHKHLFMYNNCGVSTFGSGYIDACSYSLVETIKWFASPNIKNLTTI